MRYLSRESYLFATYAYRTLFPRRVGGAHDGEYANLDFGDLVGLERLDRDLRAALLPLALDAEHLAKMRVLDEVARRPDEDGHSIVRDYMDSLPPPRAFPEGEGDFEAPARRVLRRPPEALRRRDAHMGAARALLLRHRRGRLPLLRETVG